VSDVSGHGTNRKKRITENSVGMAETKTIELFSVQDGFGQVTCRIFPVPTCMNHFGFPVGPEGICIAESGAPSRIIFA